MSTSTSLRFYSCATTATAALLLLLPRSSGAWPQFATQVAFGRPVSPGMHLLATHLYFCAPHSAAQSSRGRPLALGTHASFTQAKGEPQAGSVQLVHLHHVRLLHTERV